MKKAFRNKALVTLLAIAALALMSSVAFADKANFYAVDYEVSPTEGGSSGSALLDSSGYVIGQLTAGNTDCSQPNGYQIFDIYGKLSVSWNLGLSNYLGAKDGGDEQSASPVMSLQGRDPVTTISTPGLTLGLAANANYTFTVPKNLIDQAKKDFYSKVVNQGSERPRMTGVHMAIPEISADLWERVTDNQGNVSWRLAIKADGAKTMRLHFTAFPTDKNLTAVAYNRPEAAKARPIRRTRTATTKAFWSPVIKGDLAIIEFVTPNKPNVTIDQISYGMIDPFDDQEEGKVGSCYYDPTCYSTWLDFRKAVGQMVFESGGGQAVCTGSLMTDSSQTFEPYFYTANHCISTEYEADSLEVTFFYHTSSCNGSAPDWYSLPYTSGSDLLAHSSSTDFSLVKLDQDSPGGTAYMGWTTTEGSMNEEITVLHHPGGTVMRISFGHIIGQVNYDDDDDDDDDDDNDDDNDDNDDDNDDDDSSDDDDDSSVDDDDDDASPADDDDDDDSDSFCCGL